MSIYEYVRSPSGFVLVFFTKYVWERATVVKSSNWIPFLDAVLSHYTTL